MFTNYNKPFHILKSALMIPQTDAKFWEKVIALTFSHYSGKRISEIPLLFNNNMSQRISVKTLCVKKIMNSEEFYNTYKDEKWAINAFNSNLVTLNNTTYGDFLYWYCVEYSEQFQHLRNIVDGLYFFPSTYCHNDAILLDFQNNIILIVSNKIHAGQRDTYRKSIKKGIQSVDPNKFYLTNCTEGGTDLARGCEWWGNFANTKQVLENANKAGNR